MVVLFVFFLFVLFLLPLEFLNVLVPNFPLSDFASQVVSNWGFCGCSSFLNVGVNRLHFSAFVVELVSHGLLDGFDVFA